MLLGDRENVKEWSDRAANIGDEEINRVEQKRIETRGSSYPSASSLL